jgi:hypothetical protein
VSGDGCGQQPKYVTVFYSLHMCNVSVASLVLYDCCGFINVGAGVCASVVNAGIDVLIFFFIYRGLGLLWAGARSVALAYVPYVHS